MAVHRHSLDSRHQLSLPLYVLLVLALFLVLLFMFVFLVRLLVFFFFFYPNCWSSSWSFSTSTVCSPRARPLPLVSVPPTTPSVFCPTPSPRRQCSLFNHLSSQIFPPQTFSTSSVCSLRSPLPRSLVHIPSTISTRSVFYPYSGPHRQCSLFNHLPSQNFPPQTFSTSSVCSRLLPRPPVPFPPTTLTPRGFFYPHSWSSSSVFTLQSLGMPSQKFPPQSSSPSSACPLQLPPGSLRSPQRLSSGARPQFL